MFSPWKFSENSTKRFFTQPQSRMGTQEMLRLITRHTFGAIFQAMEAAVKLSQKAKTIEKYCSTPGVSWSHHLSTTERTPKSIKKPNLLSLFLKHDEKSLEALTSYKGTFVLTTFDKNLWEQLARSRNLHQFPRLYTLLNPLFNSNDMHHFDTRLTRLTLISGKIYLKTQFYSFSSQKFRTKPCGKIEKLPAEN